MAGSRGAHHGVHSFTVTGLSIAPVPTRDDIEAAWQAVLSFAVTRDVAHEWAAEHLNRLDSAIADLQVASGLESLCRMNAVFADQERLSDEAVAQLHVDWVRHCQAWGLHSGNELRLPQTRIARAAWRKTWHDASAQGWRVRDDIHEHWVRFHSLPRKRWPETPAEWEEVIRRHHALLDALSTTTPGRWNVSIPTYELPDEPLGRAPDTDPALLGLGPAREWQTYEPDEYEDATRHLWLYEVEARDYESLDPLLRAVADSTQDDVIIGPRDWSWVYAPYDGGADVIASASERARISARYAKWLQPGPEGL